MKIYIYNTMVAIYEIAALFIWVRLFKINCYFPFANKMTKMKIHNQLYIIIVIIITKWFILDKMHKKSCKQYLF